MMVSEDEIIEELKDVFTGREIRLIRNCMGYAGSDPAGLIGHNLMLIINKLVNFAGIGSTIGNNMDALTGGKIHDR